MKNNYSSPPTRVALCILDEYSETKFIRIFYNRMQGEHNFFGTTAEQEEHMQNDYDQKLHTFAVALKRKSGRELDSVLEQIIKLTPAESRHGHITGIKSCALPYKQFVKVMEKVV